MTKPAPKPDAAAKSPLVGKTAAAIVAAALAIQTICIVGAMSDAKATPKPTPPAAHKAHHPKRHVAPKVEPTRIVVECPAAKVGDAAPVVAVVPAPKEEPIY
jgi:hypothetical protein